MVPPTVNRLLPPELDGFQVRLVASFQARKDYTCPDCGNPIAVGETHVVAWPEERNVERRHWHRHCWRLFVRRGGR